MNRSQLTGLESLALSRKQFLTAMGAGALVLAGCGSDSGGSSSASKGTAPAKGGEVNFWTWADYWAPENLKGFTKATGTKINQSNFTSNDVMFSKLNSAGRSAFDIAIATGGWVPQLAARKALQEIDWERLPKANIGPELLGRNYDPDNKWSVPKDYGVIGVIYDPAKVKGEIKTWQDYLDAGAQPGVSGQITAPIDAGELIGVGLWSLDIDWNTENEDEIRKGAAVMKVFGKHVKSYIPGPVDGMVSGEYVMAVISHGAARNARIQNPKLKFVIPTPRTEIWVDTYVLPEGAKNTGQAYSFLTDILGPQQQIADTGYIGYPTPLPGLADKLPSTVKLADEIFVSPADLERASSWITKPKTQPLVAQLATEISGA